MLHCPDNMATISVLSSYKTGSVSVPTAIVKRTPKTNKMDLENQSDPIQTAQGTPVITKKPSVKTVPLSESTKSNLNNNNQHNIINNNQKPKKTSPKQKTPSDPQLIKPSNGGKTNQQPLAVARRNARERNRVKQVNNGFAALRQHIPDEMAEAFEAGANNRPSAAAQKKLSKVETLRMAVEYIRNLESLLNISPSKCDDQSFSFCENSFLEASSSPTSDCGNSYSSVIDEDHITPRGSMTPPTPTTPQIQVLPSVTTINGIHYLRFQSNEEFIDVNDVNNFIIVSTRPGSSPSDLENNYAFTIDPQVEQQDQILMYDQQQQHHPNTFQTNLVGNNNNNLLAPAPMTTTMPLSIKFGGGQTTVSPVLPQLKSHPQELHTNVEMESFGDKNAALIKQTFKLTNNGRMEEELDYPMPIKRQRRDEIVNEGVNQGHFIEPKQDHHLYETALNPESLYDNYQDKIVLVKSEIKDEDSDLDLLDNGITEENMMDAIDWWENDERSS